jgi:hypothetical protein
MEKLTVMDINAGYRNKKWGGFGYLGGRQHYCGVRPLMEAYGDKVLLDYANEHKWTKELLFEFCNSTYGRHYHDVVESGTREQMAKSGPSYFEDIVKYFTNRRPEEWQDRYGKEMFQE